jgi:hypothetical protein
MTFRRLAILTLALWVGGAPARASQDELVPPTSGIFTGVQFSQLLGDAIRSLASMNKGSSAPANVSGAAIDGLPWLDDSSSPWALKIHADGNWATTGYVDDVNGRWVGVLGGGIAALASAGTTDLGSVAPANVTITGTTTITSFGSSAPTGTMKVIRFDGALTLTHSTAMLVPGGYSLTTAANDRAIVTHLGSGAWEITQYTRASGVPIDVSAVGKASYGFSFEAPELQVIAAGQALSRATYPAYLAKATTTQPAVRVSGNAGISINSTAGLGAGMPVEGTGIAAGCTIASITGTTTFNLNSSSCVTSSGTATATIFLTGYGSGGGSTTVGAPDCRGLVMAGLDTVAGSAANRLTTSAAGFNTSTINAFGSAQTFTIDQTNLPAVNLSGTPNTASQTLSYTASGGAALVANSGSPGSSARNDVANITVFTAGVFSTLDSHVVTFPSSTVALGGSGSALSRVQPTLMAQCSVRVIP